MQYTTQETHLSWSMQKTVAKRTSHSQNGKCFKISKSGLFYKSHFSFLFCFVFFLPHVNSFQIFTNCLFLALLKMVSFLEY